MEQFKQSKLEDYEISNLGNIRRKLKGGGYRNLKTSIMNRGYKYIQMKRGGKRYNYLIHRLVADAFIDKIEGKEFVDHIDRNRLNNNVENLRWVTHTENMRNSDRFRNDIIEVDPVKRRLIISRQYSQDNKEKIKEHTKQYYQDNKEKIKERVKQYKETNKEKIKEQGKQYRENNKEKIAEQKKQYASRLVKCEKCNKEFRRDSLTKHNKSKKHINNCT
jgi:gas vesicle protein